MDWHLIEGEVETLLVASCYRNWNKLQPDEPLLACMQTLPFLPYILVKYMYNYLPVFLDLLRHLEGI